MAKDARAMLAVKRPDIEIVGEDLHPLGKVKDFAPYVAKMRAARADAVVTGNWGNDLALLVKAAKDAGLNAEVHAPIASLQGSPTMIAESGADRVRAVVFWHMNLDNNPLRDFALLRDLRLLAAPLGFRASLALPEQGDCGESQADD